MNYLILIQFAVFAVTIVVLLIVTKSNFQAGVVFCGGWIFALGIHLLGFIQYEYDVLSARLLGLQTLYAFAFVTGTLLQVPLLRWQTRTIGNQFNPNLVLFFNAIQLICVSILGSVVCYEMYTSGRSFLNIEETRISLWESGGEFNTPTGIIKSLVRPMVMAMLFTLPFQKSWLGKMCGFLGFFVVGVGEALLVGGRAFLALCLVGTTLAYILKRQVESSSARGADDSQAPPRTSPLRMVGYYLAGGFATFIVFYLTFGLFPSIRNSRLTGNEDLYLRFETGNSVVAPLYRSLSDDFEVPSIAVFAYGTHYLTSPMMRSNFLLLETDAPEWYLLGKNNFPLFSKVLYRLGGGRTSEQMVKEQIENAQPYGRNPWFGGVADIFIDFGIAGGALFMFLAGCISSWVYRAMRVTKQPEYFALYALILVTVLAFPYFSAVRLSMVANTALALMLLVTLKLFFRAPRQEALES